MRMSIGVPGVAVYFDHSQIKPFVKAQSEKARKVFDERLVPSVIRGTCKALELVANSTADAHDYLIRKLTAKQSA